MMIIEKSNGNGEMEIFSYKMAGYDDDIKIIQDDTDELNISKRQTLELIDILRKFVNGEEIE
ncbi:hypothetical protein WJD75_22765 [Salmonella enterica subsp. enterica serovar Corvallis]